MNLKFHRELFYLLLRSSRLFFKDDTLHALWSAKCLNRRFGTQAAYSLLKRQYDRMPTKGLAAALQALMQTSTPFDDIEKAMTSDFEPDFYRLTNPDVKEARFDPDLHYRLWGWREHRTASRFFNSGFYTGKNRLAPSSFALADYALKRDKRHPYSNPPANKAWYAPKLPSEQDWQGAPAAKRSPHVRAIVILPVYKGYEETLSAIYHALIARAGEQYALLVVNDKSPDAALSAKLRELAGFGLFEYHESDTNRGFVKTVNYALQNLTNNLDVVLLNSDAFVFEGWFGRLIGHADRDKLVATVTPLSNNATICSYPIYNFENRNALELAPQALDDLSKKANKGLSVETPTGVGFCFFMRREAIEDVGVLDEQAFKLGYGEENDFCMRALNAGFKNLIAGDVFVYHIGSVSFSAVKEKNYNDGQTALARKHPNYARLVQSHVNADPERSLRKNLDAERLVDQFKNCVLFISHIWSGGIDTYIDQCREELSRAGKNSLTMRFHDSRLVSIGRPGEPAPFTPNLEALDLATQWPFLIRFLDRLNPDLIHLNSLAGLSWHWHKKVLETLANRSTPVTFVGHDYAPISDQYQLLRPDGFYVGPPDAAELRLWNEMTNQTPSSDACDPEERHQTYSRFFDAIERIELPSQSCLKIYQNTFPEINAKVVPHADHLPDTTPAIRRPKDGRLRIAALGAMGPHKGLGVLEGLAANANTEGLGIDYYLVGYSNDDAALEAKGVTVTGAYASEEEAFERLDEIQPDMVLIPSVWPETYCYALSIVLKKRIPPIVFDLGAQGERVSAISWGALLSHHLSANPSGLSKQILALPVDELWRNISN